MGRPTDAIGHGIVTSRKVPVSLYSDKITPCCARCRQGMIRDGERPCGLKMACPCHDVRPCLCHGQEVTC
jgi:hypothetical protein